MPKVRINKPVEVEASVLKIHLKVRDGFSATLEDTNGNELRDQEDGYVPGFMPGEHYGDYVFLDIDIRTGQITNWKVPDAKELEEWIKAGQDDDE